MRIASSAADRRRFLRLPRLVNVVVRDSHGTFDAVTLDMSPGGAYVTVPARRIPPVGTTVELRPANAQVTLRGVVLRAAPLGGPLVAIPGFAVGFESISTHLGAQVLAGFLADLGAADPRPDMFDATASAPTYLPGTLARVEPGVPRSRAEAAARPTEGAIERAPSVLEALTLRQTVGWSGFDRRRDPRIATRLEARWYTDKIPSTGQVLSLSESGLFLATGHRPPGIGARLTLYVPLPEAPAGVSVQLRAVVTRHWVLDSDCAPGFGAAIRHVEERGRLGIFRLWLRRQRVRQEPSPSYSSR
jgi:hypothetical protein